MKFYDDEVCECWLCGKNGCGDPLDKHHIFGRAYRKKSEQYGLTVPLCHSECHIFGEHAVHNDPDTMQRLHEYGQRKAMAEQDWTVRQFVTEFGRNYLDIGPEDWDMTIDEIDGERRRAESSRPTETVKDDTLSAAGYTSSVWEDTSSVTVGDTFPSRGRQDGGRQDGGRQDGGRQDGGRQDGGRQDGGKLTETKANGWSFFIPANAPVMPF